MAPPELGHSHQSSLVSIELQDHVVTNGRVGSPDPAYEDWEVVAPDWSPRKKNIVPVNKGASNVGDQSGPLTYGESKASVLTRRFPLLGRNTNSTQDYSAVIKYWVGPSLMDFLYTHDFDNFAALRPYFEALTTALPLKIPDAQTRHSVIRSALVPIGRHLNNLCTQYGVSLNDRENYWGYLGTFWPGKAQDATFMLRTYNVLLREEENTDIIMVDINDASRRTPT